MDSTRKVQPNASPTSQRMQKKQLNMIFFISNTYPYIICHHPWPTSWLILKPSFGPASDSAKKEPNAFYNASVGEVAGWLVGPEMWHITVHNLRTHCSSSQLKWASNFGGFPLFPSVSGLIVKSIIVPDICDAQVVCGCVWWLRSSENPCALDLAIDKHQRI